MIKGTYLTAQRWSAKQEVITLLLSLPLLFLDAMLEPYEANLGMWRLALREPVIIMLEEEGGITSRR